jgi:hypothetical protein
MYKSYKSSHSNFEAAEETKESDLCNDAEGEKYITYDELMKRKAKIKRSYTKADMFGDLRILLGVLIICAVLFGTRRHIYKLLILIQEKSLQLFWLGAAVMVIAIITGTYYLARILLRKRVFSFHYFDNSNGFSIVDLGIKSFIPVDGYDTLFNIKIQLSSSHTGKDLMKITNLLFNLAFRKKFILAGAIYDNSALKYEILVYSNYEYSTRKALLKLLDKKVSFPYTIEKTKDSKWNIYNEYLHPDEYTLIKTVNAGWVEHLEARGHDFLKEHPVAFYLAFKNYEDSVKCVAAAEKSGFEKALYLNNIEELKDSGTLKKDYHMVGLQLTSKIGLERLNFISKQAIDFASEYNGKVEDIKLEELDSIIQ